MNIRWLGHSCFLFTNQDGVKLVTDPFNERVGLPLPNVEADVVTVSHHHHDHDYVQAISGNPQVVDSEGLHKISDLNIKGTLTYHDQEQGAKRGNNMLFAFSMDGVRAAHLGDLGHILTSEQLADIGPIDVLCIPIGGFYTIDAQQSSEVIRQLNPKIILPMHYKLDDSITLPIAGLNSFLGYFPQVERRKDLDITKDSLPREQTVIVLELK